jgi:hypothetical protein
MDASCKPLDCLGTSREEIAVSGIVDVIAWRHVFEKAADPTLLRPGQRVVVYPKFLDTLDAVLASENIGADPDLTRARLSMEQANALRAQSGGLSVQEPVQRRPTPVHSDEDDADFEPDYFQSRANASAKKRSGRAGGLATVSRKG